MISFREVGRLPDSIYGGFSRWKNGREPSVVRSHPIALAAGKVMHQALENKIKNAL